MRINCFVCGREHAEVFASWIHGQGTGNTDAQELVSMRRKFERARWLVDHRGHWFCPAHAMPPTKKEKPVGHLQANNGHLIDKTVQPPSKPKPMGRDDRRIIFAKLQEAYGDEKSGYKSDWTDDKLARDLGTETVWVAAVREEMFGPANGNGFIYAQLEDAKKVIAEGRDMLKQQAQLSLEIKQVWEAVDAIGKRLAPLQGLLQKVEGAMLDLKQKVK